MRRHRFFQAPHKSDGEHGVAVNRAIGLPSGQVDPSRDPPQKRVGNTINIESSGCPLGAASRGELLKFSARPVVDMVPWDAG
jgi:hypothetical protein